MLCDICGRHGKGTHVKSARMSNAVRAGFNPFKEGLAVDALKNMGMGLGSSYDSWRESAISGPMSKSDWNVCGRCMKVLNRYL